MLSAPRRWWCGSGPLGVPIGTVLDMACHAMHSEVKMVHFNRKFYACGSMGEVNAFQPSRHSKFQRYELRYRLQC